MRPFVFGVWKYYRLDHDHSGLHLHHFQYSAHVSPGVQFCAVEHFRMYSVDFEIITPSLVLKTIALRPAMATAAANPSLVLATSF